MSQYRLGQVEDVVAELEELALVPDDIMETDADYQMVICGWWVAIPSLGLRLYQGIFCNYEEEEEDYMPDFAVTVIKEEGVEQWVYFEQDGFACTLYNWLNGRMAAGDIENLSCEIIIPEEDL